MPGWAFSERCTSEGREWTTMSWITGPPIGLGLLSGVALSRPEPLTLILYVLILALAGLLSLFGKLLWVALSPAAEAIGRRLTRWIDGTE